MLASPSSTLKSPPCYGFSREERPRPGAKQAWRMDMKMEASSPFSPGPIYYPNVNSSRATPPKFSVTSRVKPLAGTMKNPGPAAYDISTGLGVKLRDGRFPTRPQYGFGTGTRDQANQLFLHPHARLSKRRPACLAACGLPVPVPAANSHSFRHAGNSRATTAPPASCKPSSTPARECRVGEPALSLRCYLPHALALHFEPGRVGFEIPIIDKCLSSPRTRAREVSK